MKLMFGHKGFNVLRMVREAESFFISLGFAPLPQDFWDNSLFEKPTDGRKVMCHPSAWDFQNRRQFRIMMCADVTGQFLTTTHHEMGHIQYFISYKDQPMLFHGAAHSGFRESIGDAIALSVMTPVHLQKIGLLNDTTDNHEGDINFLMSQALEKVAFLPYAYMLDKWRWEIYDGTTAPEDFNKNYWKLRCSLQGISPPVPRSEEDLDAGAKEHVVGNTAYMGYFLSHIFQFQFHKALCDIAGHVGPLYKCDIYNSKAAGDKLRRMLSLGKSKPWEDALEVLTGQRYMDARPFFEYFRPLQEWLVEENIGHDVGWDENCPSGLIR